MIGLVLSTCSPQYQKALKAFCNIGEKYRWFDNDDIVTDELKKCSWYVIVGNDVIGRKAKEYVYKSGKPFIVITGSLFNVKERTDVVRLNVNGFTNNFASMPPSDVDRWSKVRQHHNLPAKFTKSKGEQIVIVFNAKTSPALFNVDMEKWFYETCEQLTKVTDRQLFVRHHRKRKLGYNNYFSKALKQFKVKEQRDTRTGGINNDKVGCAISLTTTYSVGALALGIPNISMHEGNFVYDVTRHDITDDNLQWYPDSDRLLHHYGMLSNCEWWIHEIADGTAMKVLRPLLEQNNKQNRQWLGDSFAIQL